MKSATWRIGETKKEIRVGKWRKKRRGGTKNVRNKEWRMKSGDIEFIRKTGGNCCDENSCLFSFLERKKPSNWRCDGKENEHNTNEEILTKIQC